MEPQPVENTQRAPFPDALKSLIERLDYKGWTFDLVNRDRGQGSRGLTLDIFPVCQDSYNPGRGLNVVHHMLVPPAVYNEVSWRRWLFEQVLLVERHEACEFFKIDGKRPYAPHHGPGNDPYVVFERGTDEEARTMYTGDVNPKIKVEIGPLQTIYPKVP